MPRARKLKDHREKLAGNYHAHGCMRCSHRYEDLCQDVMEDGLCYLCRTNGEKPDPWWPEARLPQPCCMEDSRVLEPTVYKEHRDLMASLRLAGRSTWYRCRSCGRTHPFDPSKFANFPAVTVEEWRRRNA